MKVTSMQKFIKKRYKQYPFENAFKDSFGEPEQGSRWLIYGDSGNGKTELAVQLAKYMSSFCKVFFISAEQGESGDLQLCFKRNNMAQNKNVKLLSDVKYDELVTFLNDEKNKKYKAVFFDSIDYLKLSSDQYKELDKSFPDKMLVFVSWKKGNTPASSAGKAIEYMVGVKIVAKKYVAFPRCRYGGNEPYIIWHEKAKQFHSFLNQ